jgi:hypothetical protein
VEPKHAHRQNQRRIHFRRITPAQLQKAFDDIGLTILRFAWLSGAREDRVRKWLTGHEDIPPYVPVLLAVLTVPGALVVAERVAQSLTESHDVGRPGDG